MFENKHFLLVSTLMSQLRMFSAGGVYGEVLNLVITLHISHISHTKVNKVIELHLKAIEYISRFTLKKNNARAFFD